MILCCVCRGLGDAACAAEAFRREYQAKYARKAYGKRRDLYQHTKVGKVWAQPLHQWYTPANGAQRPVGYIATHQRLGTAGGCGICPVQGPCNSAPVGGRWAQQPHKQTSFYRAQQHIIKANFRSSR